MFLRADEALNVKKNDFLPKMFIVDPVGGVKALHLYIKGKKDDVRKLFAIFEDLDDHELDLVLHMLVYTQTCNISTQDDDSPLFPDFSSDPTGKTAWTYNKYYKKLDSLLRSVLVCPENFQCGTHTLRKTAYLFAVYGCLGHYFSVLDKGSEFLLALCVQISLSRTDQIFSILHRHVP